VKKFGKGPYQDTNALVHVKDERTREIQGPDSKLIKYDKNLCVNCNSSLTQPFDLAYEVFIDWVFANRAEVVLHRVIDFESVYGRNWEIQQTNLFKFYAKSFGCRLTEAGKDVPGDVIRLLRSKDPFETQLYVTFRINEDQLVLDEDYQAIGTYALYAHEDALTHSVRGYQSGLFYQWFESLFWYNYFPLFPVGAAWTANAKHVYLGWNRPLTSQQRREVWKSAITD
jgi:hypothetical protein